MSNNLDTYQKEYYQKNKNKWSEYKMCDICGSNYCNNTKTNHLKSKKHKLAIVLMDKNKQLKDLENKLNNITENDNQFTTLEKKLDLIIDDKDKQLKELENKLNIIIDKIKT
jgi:hypothetical protein